MTFNKSLHSWAFLLESEYDPNNITLSHYEVNTITLKEVGEDEHIEYRNLEWTGDILPELDTSKSSGCRLIFKKLRGIKIKLNYSERV